MSRFDKFRYILKVGEPETIDIKEYIPSMKLHYLKNVKPYLISKYKYSCDLLVPKLSNIVLSTAISNLRHDQNYLKKMYNSLYIMTNVTPVYTRAKRSISQFKLYANSIVGVKVVLRGNNMYEFLERLISIYLTNSNSFRGIPYKSLLKSSLNIGIEDINIVRELNKYLGLYRFGFTISINYLNTNSIEECYDISVGFELPVKSKKNIKENII